MKILGYRQILKMKQKLTMFSRENKKLPPNLRLFTCRSGKELRTCPVPMSCYLAFVRRRWASFCDILVLISFQMGNKFLNLCPLLLIHPLQQCNHMHLYTNSWERGSAVTVIELEKTFVFIRDSGMDRESDAHSHTMKPTYTVIHVCLISNFE